MRPGFRGTYTKRKQTQLFDPTDYGKRHLVVRCVLAGYACDINTCRKHSTQEKVRSLSTATSTAIYGVGFIPLLCNKQWSGTISFTDKLPIGISVSSVWEAQSRSGGGKVSTRTQIRPVLSLHIVSSFGFTIHPTIHPSN